MSDRYNGFAITLDKSVKKEDAKQIIDAILMLKGVINVDPIIEDISSKFSKNQVRYELGQKLWKVLYDEDK